MIKQRLDQALVELGLCDTRSQAENYIRLSKVSLEGKVITKPGYSVKPSELELIKLGIEEKYVSRAALKLDSVAIKLGIDFKNKIVLDIGSSTGGFSDYAIKHGASKVIAVDVGTNQLHPSLRDNEKIELHEKTDIRNFKFPPNIDLVLMDLSFISLREILPYVHKNISNNTQIIAMIKPQFESGHVNQKHKGVIKNDKLRRQILSDFELWVKNYFVIKNKADSSVSGTKGNLERFYLLYKT